MVVLRPYKLVTTIQKILAPIHHTRSRAFVGRQGLYEFRVMPFGLSNAPAVFQCLMQKVVMGFVSVYLDDIVIFSRTLEEHLDPLRAVRQRIVDANLKLELSKCMLFARKWSSWVTYLPPLD